MSLSVFGFGSVGQALAKQAVNNGLRVLAVADSSAAIISNKDSFNLKKLHQLCSFKTSSQHKLIDFEASANENIIPWSDTICNELPSDSIVADCSATKHTTQFLKNCQQRGIAVTMANKKPLTQSMEDFNYLTQDRSRIRFESTVCAALPVVTSVGRILDSADKIIQIEGRFSGTIGFMLSELTPHIRMSDVIKKALQYGYTEPDLREDLRGLDCARKALILARCIGLNLEMSDVERESLYPPEMDSLSLDEFMQNLNALDEKMAEKVLSAVQNGSRLRYTATINVQNKSVRVGLVEVPPQNALYHMVGTDNLVSIQSEWYKSPLIISGPGAGEEMAAGAMLSDMYELKGIALKKQWGATQKQY